MDDYIIAAIVFLAFILGSRAISNKANKTLSAEKKAELVELFSTNRNKSYLILVLILAVHFALLKLEIMDEDIVFGLFFASFLGFMGYNSYAGYHTLKTNNFPKNYTKTYLVATILRYAGIVSFVVIMLVGMFIKF